MAPFAIAQRIGPASSSRWSVSLFACKSGTLPDSPNKTTSAANTVRMAARSPGGTNIPKTPSASPTAAPATVPALQVHSSFNFQLRPCWFRSTPEYAAHAAAFGPQGIVAWATPAAEAAIMPAAANATSVNGPSMRNQERRGTDTDNHNPHRSRSTHKPGNRSECTSSMPHWNPSTRHSCSTSHSHCSRRLVNYHSTRVPPWSLPSGPQSRQPLQAPTWLAAGYVRSPYSHQAIPSVARSLHPLSSKQSVLPVRRHCLEVIRRFEERLGLNPFMLNAKCERGTVNVHGLNDLMCIRIADYGPICAAK